jgi:DNA-binding IclR family transcriptional regulator
MLGRSDLRMHAYPVLRDYAVQSGCDLFLAVPSAGEVTAVRCSAGCDVALSTDYGREMPAHCVRSAAGNGRPLSADVRCVRLTDARDVTRGLELLRRLEAGQDGNEALAVNGGRLGCTCAPVFDYSGREVARIGVCGPGVDDRALAGVHNRGAWELARHVSMRLGYLSAVAMGVR